MARIALFHPDVLVPHAAFLKKIALEDIPHILMRYFASKAALCIERKFPDTYDSETVRRLKTVNCSPFDKLHVESNHKRSRNTPWLNKGAEDNRNNIHFEFDFDRYWFEPLGEVFGISSKQVQDKAATVIREDWQLSVPEGYATDPRSEQRWNYGRERLTGHSHCSYPKADTHSFYYSYHAMLWAAGKLLETMPVVEDSCSWEEDEWEYWMSRHTLSLDDGRWLSDTRDPQPLEHRKWFDELETNNDWRWEVMPSDFLDVLMDGRENNRWIYVAGQWSFTHGDRKETISLSTALVTPEMSMPLLRALQSSSNSYDYKIPDANDPLEIHHGDFVLQGWLTNRDGDKCFDEFDPNASRLWSVNAAPEPALFIQEQFSLHADETKRIWLSSDNSACLISELWSNGGETEQEKCIADGRRIKASSEFLTRMLKSLDRHLIIELQIRREFCNTHYNQEEEHEIKYAEPYCQLFLLDATGKLRTLQASYEFGEIAGERARIRSRH